MTEVLDVRRQAGPTSGTPLERERAYGPPREQQERAARRTLGAQVARLERELGTLFASSFLRNEGIDFGLPARASGARLLDLGELEELRDALAARLGDARTDLAARERAEQGARRRLDEMLRDPGAHKWERISAEDIGQPGCTQWHVRPVLGPVGALMGWWRVRVSSGCPLAGGRGRRP